MAGRGFLQPASEMVVGPTEFHWRSTAVNAYYALFLECRDALLTWSFQPARRDNIHAWVRLRFTYSRDNDLKWIASILDTLVRLRNEASYNLTSAKDFNTSVRASKAIQEARDALTHLDLIQGDAARRAAAIASI